MNKTLITIFSIAFFSISFLLPAQQKNRGISAEEKRELEKKFAGLKTFYIADDGTVVFYQQNENSVPASTQQAEETPPQPKVKVKVSVDEAGDYVVTSEESNYEYIETQEIPTEADYIQPENASGSTIVIETREEYTHTPSKNEETVVNEPVEDITEIVDEPAEDDTLNNKVKKEVFKKRVSSYKSLEEAALAVDELLEDLKRQQAEYNNRGKNSLSRKLTGKVDGSLRKTPYDFDDAEENNASSAVPPVSSEEFGDEPTYYINGVESTKEEVEKLKKGDIRKKIVKRSRANPNGEWWIETVKPPVVTE